MAAAFFIILHLLSAKLYHVKIDAAINFLEVVLEGIVLLSDFLTTRWVTAYERQQRRDQDIHRSHTPSWYKIISILFVNFCLFLLLFLEITHSHP
jgi:hypothetical protein